MIHWFITCTELAALTVLIILLGWQLVMASFFERSFFQSDNLYDSDWVPITTALATNHSSARDQVANQLAAYAALRENNPDLSRREAAKKLGIPESTLRYWQQRQDNIAAPPALVAFFSSPEGEAFIHRLLVALQLTMGFVAPTGIRNICQFLELSGLDSFVASSYGSRRQYLLEMEQKIVDFAQEQEQELCKNMEEKEIAVVEDETYKPGVHLVAIEPLSNFILLEQLADNRQADTWTTALKSRLEKIPVQVIQGISDEAVGICKHIEQGFKAHHSPDLFHIQQELARAFWPILSNRIHKASQKISQIEQELSQLRQKRKVFVLICADDLEKASKEAPGVHQFLKELDEKIKQSSQKKEIEVNQLQKAEEQARRAQELIQKINSSYHPYNLEDGSVRTTSQLDQLLRKCFNEIKQLATEAQLPDKSCCRI